MIFEKQKKTIFFYIFTAFYFSIIILWWGFLGMKFFIFNIPMLIGCYLIFIFLYIQVKSSFFYILSIFLFFSFLFLVWQNFIVVNSVFETVFRFVESNFSIENQMVFSIFKIFNFEALSTLELSTEENFAFNKFACYYYFSAESCRDYLLIQQIAGDNLSPWIFENIFLKIFSNKILKIELDG